MSRNNKKNSGIGGPDEHLESLGELLTQLRTHLTAAPEKKGTWSDYLRLLEFYRETRDVSSREIFIHWVDSETPRMIE